MPRSDFIPPLALVAVVAFFFYALLHITLLRYQRGDLYPPYSTFRSDPLGARAYYEALDATGNYQVSRGFVSLHRELSTRPDTLFLLGFTSEDFQSFSQDEVGELSDYVQKGGRVVIAMEPSDSESPETPAKNKDNPAKKPTKASAVGPTENEPVPAKTEQEKFERTEFKKAQDHEDESQKRGEFPEKFEPSLQAVWGFGWTADAAAQGDTKSGGPHPGDDNSTSAQGDVLAIRVGPAGAESQVPWKSAGYFLRLEPAWQVKYQARGKPVLIERDWGKGRILLASDSYFLSNEALRDDRKPILLNYVTGAGPRLLFDEVHLGTEEKEGVMVLARRFRLEGYLLGMLIVAALFLWRNSIPLVPPRPAGDPTLLGGAISGKDSRNGLVNLLRRNIAPRELLQVCLAEWKRTAAPDRPVVSAKVAAMDAVLQSGNVTKDEQIVRAYHELREINLGDRHKESYANRN